MPLSRKKDETASIDLPAPVVLGLYLLLVVLEGIFFLLFYWIWGDHFQMSTSAIWHSKGSLSDAIAGVWFVFAFGIGAVILHGLWNIFRKEPRQHEPMEILVKGTFIGLNAGFFEEVIWRWMFFLMCFVLVPAINFITFGLLKLMNQQLLIPLANWVTLGKLSHELTGMGWIFGSAIIMSAASFRDAHEENGLVNMVVAWFGGMIFFWLMFNYGLIAAIVVHALYDITVFAGSAFMANFLPAKPQASLFEAAFMRRGYFETGGRR